MKKKGKTVRKDAPNRYSTLLAHIFSQRHKKGATTVEFERADIERAATELGVKLPKNLGDVLYSFRYRADLPESIRKAAPKGKVWLIQGAGIARYAFVASDVKAASIVPTVSYAESKIPDATPGIIAMYALNDEQALLAKLRYNRLIDIFTGVTCSSLQSHLRTTAKSVGQVETDEVYVGVDKRGAHFVFPVQAKGGKDRISTVQIGQDVAMCAEKFPNAICRPIAAQFMADDKIALFEFEQSSAGVVMSNEKHYRLVPHDDIEDGDLAAYQRRTE